MALPNLTFSFSICEIPKVEFVHMKIGAVEL